MAKAQSPTATNVATESIAEKHSPVTAEKRYQMIAEAAYFLAEKRGFTGGDMAEDWRAAEAQIDQTLRDLGRLHAKPQKLPGKRPQPPGKRPGTSRMP